METQELAKRLLEAVMSGGLSWLNALAVGLLILVVATLRAGLKRLHPFFDSPGGVILVNVVASGLAAAATTILGGASFTWALVGAALVMSVKAAGGVSLLKHLLPLVPGLPALLLKIPFVAKLFPPKSEVVALPVVAPVAAPTSDSIVNGR